MATISASTGQILSSDGTPMASSGSQGGSNPYGKYVANMGNLLAYITAASATGNANMAANIEGLQRGEANLATPNGVTLPGGATQTSNPLGGILNLMPGSMRTGTEATLSDVMKPAILSNQAQAATAQQNSANLTNEVNAQSNLYKSYQDAGIGSNTIGQIPGSLAQYSYDSRTGQFTNLSTGAQSSTPPPSNATQQEINTTQKGMQSYATNYYQTNSTPKPEMTPTGGAGSVQGDWKFNGTEWQLSPSMATQAAALNSYIKDHSKGSPISGLMIQNAANHAGVDPWKLAAMLANQSDFGTSGEPANPNQSWTLTVNDIAKQMAASNAQNPSVGPVTKTPAPSNPVDLIAWQILNGLKSPSDGKGLVADINSGGIALNNSLMRQSNNTYDEGTTQAKYDAKQGSITTQTTTVNDLSAARQSVGNIANSLISQIASNSNLNPSDLNGVNSLIQKIAGQTSNPQYQTLLNRMTDIASTYSGILTPGGNTDSTRRLAQDLVDKLASGSSIQKVIVDLDTQAQEKISGIQTNIENISSGINTNPLNSFINSIGGSTYKGFTLPN